MHRAETGVGALSNAQFGAARCNVSHPSDISFFLSLRDDLVAEPVSLKDDSIGLPRRPGNGAILDGETIKMYRLD